MKQHISVDEFYKLSKEQQRRLEVWCFTHRYFTRLALPGEPARFTDTKTEENQVLNPIELSIGQMIEFLEDNKDAFDPNIPRSKTRSGKRVYAEDIDHTPRIEYQHPSGMLFFSMQWDGELCDALWKAVKEKLEKEAKKD